jgi:hypothetical protein
MKFVAILIYTFGLVIADVILTLNILPSIYHACLAQGLNPALAWFVSLGVAERAAGWMMAPYAVVGGIVFILFLYLIDVCSSLRRRK